MARREREAGAREGEGREAEREERERSGEVAAPDRLEAAAVLRWHPLIGRCDVAAGRWTRPAGGGKFCPAARGAGLGFHLRENSGRATYL